MKRRRFRFSLRTRLLVSYLAVCVIGIGVLFVTVRLTAPSFFERRVQDMPGYGGGGQGATRRAEEAAQLDDAMNRSLNQGLAIAAAVALAVGVAASILLARQVSGPASQMARASKRIARGEYTGRVAPAGPPEFVELAASFNAMAGSLEGVERRRRELIGDVAHELRTPITVIRGYVEGLADGVFPASGETWAKLEEEAARLGRLVEELSELSRAESGALPLAFASVPPAAAIAATRQSLGPQFAEKGLALVIDLPDDLPPVRADPDRLAQVLANLLTNALKYTLAPGTVTVTARHSAGAVAFEVRDTGIGISPEDLPQVFERFYRVDRSRSRSSGGSGVGLTIARALAVAMGGSLEAASLGVGKGSTFTLRLPIHS